MWVLLVDGLAAVKARLEDNPTTQPLLQSIPDGHADQNSVEQWKYSDLQPIFNWRRKALRTFESVWKNNWGRGEHLPRSNSVRFHASQWYGMQNLYLVSGGSVESMQDEFDLKIKLKAVAYSSVFKEEVIKNWMRTGKATLIPSELFKVIFSKAEGFDFYVFKINRIFLCPI